MRERDVRLLPRLLVLFLMVTIVANAGCDGGQPGDNGDLDGGVDAQQQDAWTFECPAEQPDGYVCIRGQIRDIVTDEPVFVSGGGSIERYVAENPGTFATSLDTVEVVQEDGRFIFPSVVENTTYDTRCDGPQCDHHIYDQFDLRLGTALPGYVVPDNKFGYGHTTDYELSFYVLRDEDVSQWEASWPTQTHMWCDGAISLDLDQLYKTVIGLCYDSLSDPPIPDTLDGTLPVYVTSGSTWGFCDSPLLLDRLAFDDFRDETLRDSYSGVAVVAMSRAPASTDEALFLRCVDSTEFIAFGPLLPTYGMIGPMGIDTTGSVVVVHSILY